MESLCCDETLYDEPIELHPKFDNGLQSRSSDDLGHVYRDLRRSLQNLSTADNGHLRPISYKMKRPSQIDFTRDDVLTVL